MLAGAGLGGVEQSVAVSGVVALPGLLAVVQLR